MKRIYTLLFNLTLISSYSVAKPSKIDSKYESDQQSENFSSVKGKKVNYTIKSGDTLLAIAREHYTTRAEIRAENKMKEGERLKLGRILKVPTHTFYPKNVLVKHPIAKGDTLYTIAQKYHTTTAEICTVNSITTKTSLKLGRILKVPTNTYKTTKKSTDSTPTKKTNIIEYAIKSGDTLFKVAKKYKSTSKEVGKLNNLGKNDNLKIGMIIKVPVNSYITDKETPKEVNTKSPLTIASVVNQEKQKNIDIAEEKEAKEKAEEIKAQTEKKAKAEAKIKEAEEKAKALKVAIAQREIEEQSILDRAEAIKKKRQERAVAEEKAKKTREAAAKKAEAEKAKIIAEKIRIAKLKAEAEKKALEAKKKAEEDARQAKIKAEKEAKEKVRQARIEANRVEKARLEKLLDVENAKLAKIQKEMEDLKKQAKLKAELLVKAKEKIKEAKLKSNAIGNSSNIKKDSSEKVKLIEKKEPIKKEEKKKKEVTPKKESAKNTLKTPTTIVTQNSQIIDYKVKVGDNLYKIAKAHHTTTLEVRDTNKFRSNSDLVVGKMIKVPIDTYFHLKNYKIRSGDTLYKIARKHNTTTSRVLLANKMSRRNKLIKGDVIKVPVDTFSVENDIDTVRVASNTVNNTFKKKEEKKKITKKPKLPQYKIQAGDTLYTIARNSKTSVKKLKYINKIKSNKDLRIGKFIALPKGKKFVRTKLAKQHTAVRVRKHKEEKVVINTNKNKSFESFMNSLGGNSGRKALPKTAKKHLGKRYVWGATGPYRFDCSGFTSYVCKKNGVCIPRTSINQSKVGKYVSRGNLVAGDLIFFDTSKRRKGYVNHVGIYIGNNKFIHASSAKKKVVVTSLNKPFYKSRFKWGRRVDM